MVQWYIYLYLFTDLQALPRWYSGISTCIYPLIYRRYPGGTVVYRLVSIHWSTGATPVVQWYIDLYLFTDLQALSRWYSGISTCIYPLIYRRYPGGTVVYRLVSIHWSTGATPVVQWYIYLYLFTDLQALPRWYSGISICIYSLIYRRYPGGTVVYLLVSIHWSTCATPVVQWYIYLYLFTDLQALPRWYSGISTCIYSLIYRRYPGGTVVYRLVSIHWSTGATPVVQLYIYLYLFTDLQALPWWYSGISTCIYSLIYRRYPGGTVVYRLVSIHWSTGAIPVVQWYIDLYLFTDLQALPRRYSGISTCIYSLIYRRYPGGTVVYRLVSIHWSKGATPVVQWYIDLYLFTDLKALPRWYSGISTCIYSLIYRRYPGGTVVYRLVSIHWSTGAIPVVQWYIDLYLFTDLQALPRRYSGISTCIYSLIYRRYPGGTVVYRLVSIHWSTGATPVVQWYIDLYLFTDLQALPRWYSGISTCIYSLIYMRYPGGTVVFLLVSIHWSTCATPVVQWYIYLYLFTDLQALPRWYSGISTCIYSLIYRRYPGGTVVYRLVSIHWSTGATPVVQWYIDLYLFTDLQALPRWYSGISTCIYSLTYRRYPGGTVVYLLVSIHWSTCATPVVQWYIYLYLFTDLQALPRWYIGISACIYSLIYRRYPGGTVVYRLVSIYWSTGATPVVQWYISLYLFTDLQALPRWYSGISTCIYSLIYRRYPGGTVVYLLVSIHWSTGATPVVQWYIDLYLFTDLHALPRWYSGISTCIYSLIYRRYPGGTVVYLLVSIHWSTGATPVVQWYIDLYLFTDLQALPRWYSGISTCIYLLIFRRYPGGTVVYRLVSIHWSTCATPVVQWYIDLYLFTDLQALPRWYSGISTCIYSLIYRRYPGGTVVYRLVSIYWSSGAIPVVQWYIDLYLFTDLHALPRWYSGISTCIYSLIYRRYPGGTVVYLLVSIHWSTGAIPVVQWYIYLYLFTDLQALPRWYSGISTCIYSLIYRRYPGGTVVYLLVFIHWSTGAIPVVQWYIYLYLFTDLQALSRWYSGISTCIYSLIYRRYPGGTVVYLLVSIHWSTGATPVVQWYIYLYLFTDLQALPRWYSCISTCIYSLIYRRYPGGTVVYLLVSIHWFTGATPVVHWYIYLYLFTDLQALPRWYSGISTCIYSLIYRRYPGGTLVYLLVSIHWFTGATPVVHWYIYLYLFTDLQAL